jgi:hypothetical protein
MLLRDFTNLRFIDDATIADGILPHLRVVVLCGGTFYRKATLDALREWTARGGLLVAYNMPGLRAAEDDTDYLPVLFDPQGGEKQVELGCTLFIPYNSAQEAERTYTLDDPISAMLAGQQRKVEDYPAGRFDSMLVFLQSHGIIVSDGVIDGIFTAQLSDRMLVLNTHLEAREKEIVLPDGRHITLSLSPNSISSVS